MNEFNPNQLDLSKFPHLMPQDDAEEIAARSKALTTIREAFENFFKLLSAYVNDLKTYDEKTKYLNTIERNLKQFEYELQQKETILATRENELQGQKDYIEEANRNIKIKQEELEENKTILAEIKKEKEEWEKRKHEALLAENKMT